MSCEFKPANTIVGRTVALRELHLRLPLSYVLLFLLEINRVSSLFYDKCAEEREGFAGADNDALYPLTSCEVLITEVE